MRARYHDGFTTIRTEGAILPRDLLARIAAGDKDLGGITPDAYHLSGEKLGEATTRAWHRLQGAWAAFRKETDPLRPEACSSSSVLDPGTSPTRERWLLPLFQELGYGRLPTARARDIDGRTYAISHAWGNVPIHLVGLNVDLDKRAPGVAGAAQASPHSLLQELLNRSDEYLWGFVSNGLTLRILRDNRSLTRQAYVEFDLDAMMTGEAYSDFALLYLVCHESRIEGERPDDCWLEKWSRAAETQGTRALDQLRKGVEEAIGALGVGFLAHPANAELHRRLQEGEVSDHDYYRDLLRLVYRLLFLFVAEDRGLLLNPAASAEAKELYARFYSTARLRRLAERRRGGRHCDLYQGLRLVMAKLAEEGGCPELGLPALGGFLFSEEGPAGLGPLDIANRDLLAAVRGLAFTTEGRVRRAVDYRNLGSEELGSVYEALLELHPEVNGPARTFALSSGGGSERKTTGSYYTPTSLIQCLLDSALDPVVDEAARKPNPEAAILGLRVCDPACGSGHFLVAAAHRLAKRLAAIRTGDEEPSPEAQRTALRDVIGHCLYGVDVNPMAVELCKVSLWMEALEPGKPLSFLDHRILCGNSLLGATPALLAAGIPDEAFQALEGDNKKVASELKKRNQQERQGQATLFAGTLPTLDNADLAASLADIDRLADDFLGGVRAKEERYRGLFQSATYRRAKLAADAWCAAFVCRKVPGVHAITHDVFARLSRDAESVPQAVRDEVADLAEQNRFLHWHLAFPDVFGVREGGACEGDRGPGWTGGFDVVLGNPPWERVKLQEKEFFDSVRPDIANAANAATRKRLIASLLDEDPGLYSAFLDARRQSEGESHFFRASGRYPLSGLGDINIFAVFTELGVNMSSPFGAVGLIIPTGLVTDLTLQRFFNYLIERERLISVTGFENEEFLFAGIANVVRYCALAVSGSLRRQVRPRFSFYIRNPAQLSEEDRYFSLTKAEIAELNPNSKTCPIFRTRFDADLTLRLYRRFPILRREDHGSNPWDISFLRMFDMANDSHLFFQEPGSERLPLYEAKLFWHYDHRFGSYEFKGVLKGKGGRGLPDMPLENHRDTTYSITPQYWVARHEVANRLRGVWKRDWLLAYRQTASAKVERTLIASVLPYSAVNHKAPLILLGESTRHMVCEFLGCFNSLVLDYIARQKVGGTDVGYFHLDQLPFPQPTEFSQADARFVRPRVLELVFAAEDVRGFAADLGWDGGPFRWDQDRRFLIQCELDAFYARLYGLTREEWLFVLDPGEIHGEKYPGESFRVLKEKEISRHGEFRTKRVCLEFFDEMERCAEAGLSYVSPLEATSNNSSPFLGGDAGH